MSGLELENLETEELETTEQREMAEQEEAQEAMGYSSDYKLWNRPVEGQYDNNHRRQAHEYYYRSRNGHQEALAGVTFEDVLRRRDPEVPLPGEGRNCRAPVEAPKPETEKTAEAPMGNLLREALEKQGLQGEKLAEAGETPEKRVLQTSVPYPGYNVSFRGKETDEQQEEKEAMGYSSDYYESEMAKALEKGNQIAYDNARRNWAKAKVKEG